MTQREITIIEQQLINYYRILSMREDVQSRDDCRLIEKALRSLSREKQENRNEHLIDTIKSWLKNTMTYLLGR